MAQYLLICRDTDEKNATFAAYTPEQLQQTMGEMLHRYTAWTERLRQEGRLLGGMQLGDDGTVLHARGGQIVVDGPYTETKESIGGTFQIEAADLAEATEIARGCPAMRYGDVVEVREIVRTPDTQP